MDLVSNIKKFAKIKGVNLYDLETKLGYAHGSISKWSKREPSVYKVKDVAIELETSIDQLMGLENQPDFDIVNPSKRKLELLKILAKAYLNDEQSQILIDCYNEMKSFSKLNGGDVEQT